jgi:hypothetical protein
MLSSRRIAIVAALLALAVSPSSALARGGADDGGGGGGGGGGHGGRPVVQASGSCGRGASSHIRLKADDGLIEVEFEMEHSRRLGARWSLVLVHERRVDWRGRARAHRPSGSFSVTRRVRDLVGADHVLVRAVGPRGITCSAAATLPG